MQPRLGQDDRSATGPRLEGRRAIRAVTDTYSDLAIWLYSKVRFLILRQPFLDEIGQYLPVSGRILDLGCGFGLFSLYFALRMPACEITGIDRNEKRIGHARASAGKLGLDNVAYRVGSALEGPHGEGYDAIYMLDLVHHLPAASVPAFLRRTRERLNPGGILLLKEVAHRPRHKMLFALLLDRMVVGQDPIRYWPPRELVHVLEDLGFSVKTHRMTDFLPYPHILYIARRSGGS